MMLLQLYCCGLWSVFLFSQLARQQKLQPHHRHLTSSNNNSSCHDLKSKVMLLREDDKRRFHTHSHEHHYYQSQRLHSLWYLQQLLTKTTPEKLKRVVKQLNIDEGGTKIIMLYLYGRKNKGSTSSYFQLRLLQLQLWRCLKNKITYLE